MSMQARHPASFRDPAGFLFEDQGVLYRAVHPDAAPDVDLLFASGLYNELVAQGLLVAHRRADERTDAGAGWLTLQPERLPVISYACEWTDAQLHAAAMLTLDIQRRALRHGMSLKDASSFNVQFVGARAVFIDILSFTRANATPAWVAYRQFCEHFLGPLALRRHVPGAAALAGAALEGIPLSLVARLLPWRTWLQPGLALHVHLHARAMSGADGTAPRAARPGSPAAAQAFGLRLTESLEAAVRRTRPALRSSAWSDYRQNNTYSSSAADTKLEFVAAAVARSGATRAVDLGANDGHYARELVARGVACTAVEMDAACCERIYQSSLSPACSPSLNTLRVDLTNPTPAHGWHGRERASFIERLRCDATLSLAIVHHLSITHQVPFDAIAAMLADLAPDAIVEYVPTSDAMSQRLLAARTGITPAYLATLSEQAFLEAFGARFDCLSRSEPLAHGRILFHFRRRAA